jgi:hypothetical protein
VRNFPLRRLFVAIVLVGCSPFLPACVVAQSSAMPLRSSVAVRGDSIFLSDLLGAGVSGDLRSKAEAVTLGVAPTYGFTRNFSRSTLLAVLATNGFRADRFLVPAVVSVTRDARPITAIEVFEALRRALVNNNLSDLVPIKVEDVSLDAAVFVPPQECRLEVTQMSFDDLIGRARFRFWTPSSPSVAPFYVTAKLPRSPDFNSFREMSASSALPGSISRGHHLREPILIQPGHQARLHLHSANSSLLLQVTPLQSGHLGELIRVRLPANGHVLQARVLPNGVLDANF